MIFCGLDTETTGLLHPDHRIIEFYGALYDGSGAKLDELLLRIDPQRSIAADAQRVHGISSSDLIGSPTWGHCADQIHTFVDKADVIVGHNLIAFDMPFLNQEFTRVGMSKIVRPALFDTMENARWATYSGKLPTLQELCFACAVEYDPGKAHAANYDVDVMMNAFFRARGWGYFAEKVAA